MRHRCGIKKLRRPTDHRLAMLRNMAVSLVEKGRIQTTIDRAKALRSFIEPIITLGKKGGLSSVRLAIQKLHNEQAVKKIFSEISPKFTNRPGGYTRILKTGIRNGDRATLAIIEFVESEGKTAEA